MSERNRRTSKALPRKISETLIVASFASFLAFGAKGQQEMVTIHISLIDGRTGIPMGNRLVGLEDRAGYGDISVRADASGLASLTIRRDAVILTHNTHDYVNCGDEAGGLIHNDFNVNRIFATGLVQSVPQPNRCQRTSAVAKPGELDLFVRPWEPGEDI